MRSGTHALCTNATPLSCRAMSRNSRPLSVKPSCRTSRRSTTSAHGRNWKKWWRHEHKDERNEYLYTPPAIKEFGETLTAVKKIGRKAYGYMNNHADAQSVAVRFLPAGVTSHPVTRQRTERRLTPCDAERPLMSAATPMSSASTTSTMRCRSRTDRLGGQRSARPDSRAR